MIRETRTTTSNAIPTSLAKEICARISENKTVRRSLPLEGRVHIDRQLPFLCVYRHPDHPDAGTAELVKSEASYLIASPEIGTSLNGLLRDLVKILSNEFGAFLIIELWASPGGDRGSDPAVPGVAPMFEIHAPKKLAPLSTVETLEGGLRKITVLKQQAVVTVFRDGKAHPEHLKPILSSTLLRTFNCSVIGIAVPPVYRAPDSQQLYPQISQAVCRSLGLAMRQAFFDFSSIHTTHSPKHFHSLGRKAVVKAVWQVDQQLADVSNSFDYLLQLTPVNPVAAWKEFKRGKFIHRPEFHYRPLPINPGLLKRKLFSIPIDRVEDPALHQLFLEKQCELDQKITMLRDRDTPGFVYESLQLFGKVSDKLYKLASDLLELVPPQRERKSNIHVNAEQFKVRADEEFKYYRDICPSFKAKSQVTSEVPGVLVSRGVLLIGTNVSTPKPRVEALIQHEVGTHLLTYYNGRIQPFKQLYTGLAGYEELQEGLAVLSEFLVGGLTKSRVRQLAARVVAARLISDGADFVETFRTLNRTYEIPQQAAFTITMRIYRGGGLTKDAIYLRGLREILRYIGNGGELDPLFIGKMAIEQIPLIMELQHRKILLPPPLRPRYLDSPKVQARLKYLRETKRTVIDLIKMDKQ